MDSRWTLTHPLWKRQATRRRYLVGLGTLTGATLLAACQSLAPAKSTVVAPTATPKVVASPQVNAAATIRVMTGINTRAIPLFEKVVQAWNEAHPDGPKIENMARPGINILQQYETMTAGATAPDLVALDPTQAVIFSAKGTLLPLDSYIQQDKYDLSDFFKISLSEYVWKGQLYALPRGYSNQLVFVNLKMFQEDQLPLPPADFNAPGWTFDDLLETATKLTKRDSSGRISQYGFMVQTGGLRGGYGFWIWSAGGEFFDKDFTRCTLDEKAANGIQFMQDLIYKYEVSPKPSDLNEITYDNMFLTDRVAMLIDPAANIEAFRVAKFDWDYAANPKGVARRLSTGGGVGWEISKSTRYPEAAWQVLKHVASAQSQKTLATEWFGPRHSVLDYVMAEDKNLPPHRRAVAVQGQEALHIDPIFPLWRQIDEQIVQKELSLVWLNQESGAEAVKKLVPAIDAFLKKYA